MRQFFLYPLSSNGLYAPTQDCDMLLTSHRSGMHTKPANLIDSLGMILFPLGQPIFEKLGPAGISMFYISTIVSQLVYSCGGSIFKGGIGSEMVCSPRPRYGFPLT
jgi:hypothetical protein